MPRLPYFDPADALPRLAEELAALPAPLKAFRMIGQYTAMARAVEAAGIEVDDPDAENDRGRQA